MKKKLAATAIVAALSIGTITSISTAQADRGFAKGGPSQVATVLSELVTNGTLTQAQSDAITAALTAAKLARPLKPLKPNDKMGGMGKGKKMHGPDDDDDAPKVSPNTTSSSLKKSASRPSIV